MVDAPAVRRLGSFFALGALGIFSLLVGGGAPALAQTAAPIATAPANWPGTEVDLMSLERKGSVVTVKWAVRNDGDADVSVYFGLTREADTYLVDEENGTKYYALTDKEGNALATEDEYVGPHTSGISQNVPAGQTRRFWAKFPAPPPEVKTLTVLFAQTEPFEEVRIVDR